MERKTKFNLDQKIENWKLVLSLDSNMTIDNICELESHLLDEMELLQIQGLTEEESYIVGLRRIGSIKNITVEYSKVNQLVHYRNMILPYLNGILLFLLFSYMVEFFSLSSLLLTYKLEVNQNYANLVSIGMLTTITLCFIGAVYMKLRNNNFNFAKLKNIPLLAILIIIARIGTVILIPMATRVINMDTYGMFYLNMAYYKMFISLALLAVSWIVFHYTTNGKKIEIAE